MAPILHRQPSPLLQWPAFTAVAPAACAESTGRLPIRLCLGLIRRRSDYLSLANTNMPPVNTSCAFCHNPVTYMLGLTNVCCVWCSQGAQPLYWGATEEGQLLLGSHLDELEGCSPTATMFPPGAPDCMLHVSCFWILEVDVWYWDFVGTAVRVYSTFTVHALASSATSRV
jgi:hypothetical protein